jgi:heme/copper-type cytochrome/quinol oxidase subunit 2
MQIKVIIETEEEYNAWLAEQETFSSLVSTQ